ncbi:hypothetical protein LZ32DRAFT_654852 [Colletotrichum eremochloae]|nr:hypothetical protein LZ32DRAFT_654852 [Colletotrichum eremochloae]
MNTAMGIGLYLAARWAVRGAGAVVAFPGTEGYCTTPISIPYRTFFAAGSDARSARIRDFARDTRRRLVRYGQENTASRRESALGDSNWGFMEFMLAH